MSSIFKPSGYNSLSPYLIVDGAKAYIDFVKTVFNAQELRLYEHPDGSVMHAEVRIDDSVIMLADASKRYPTTSFWMHVYVPDAQAVYDRAVHYGCEGIEAPVQKDDDPDRRGTFRDLTGNFWSLSTQV